MAPVRPDAVLKVGGSLGRRPRRLRRLMAALGALAPPRTLVVVPGGGLFAEEVRRADRRFALDPSSSHWMAILAMDHPWRSCSACITAQSSSHCIRPSCPAPGFDTPTVAGGTVRS